jgi:hypothetical protein
LPVHDAAYGGNSRLAHGLAPTGSMQTLRGRMIGFRRGGKCKLESIEEKMIPKARVVRCGNSFAIK